MCIVSRPLAVVVLIVFCCALILSVGNFTMGAAKAALAKIYVLAATMGGPGLFVIAVGDSSFVSIPEGNDILIIALSIGQSWARMSYLVLMTIAGSVVGCTLLYAVGSKGG